jgi:hypothetical protein
MRQLLIEIDVHTAQRDQTKAAPAFPGSIATQSVLMGTR